MYRATGSEEGNTVRGVAKRQTRYYQSSDREVMQVRFLSSPLLLAQLVRATELDSVGSGFESHANRLKNGSSDPEGGGRSCSPTEAPPTLEGTQVAHDDALQRADTAS